MSAFVNSIQLGKEFKNYTTVLEFTTGTYEEEGESVLQKKVPVRFEVYETDVSINVEIHINVTSFSSISYCGISEIALQLKNMANIQSDHWI